MLVNRNTGKTYLQAADKNKVERKRIYGVDPFSGDRTFKYGFYDIINTTIVETGKDGRPVVSYKKEYQLKYTRHPIFSSIPDIDFSGQGGFQDGGVYFTTKTSGGSDRTKYQSLSPTSTKEVGEFLDAVSVLATGQGIKGELGLQNAISDWVSAGTSVTSNWVGSNDYYEQEGQKKERDGGANIGGSKAINEDKEPSKVNDTAYFPYKP